MARCYEIICQQCQEAYWSAQRDTGDDTIHWYDPAKVCGFLERHRGHRVMFDEDQNLPDPDAADWVRPFEPAPKLENEMKTLYDISAELSALEELLIDSEGDVSDEQIEATIDKWFAEIADAEAEKVDNYCCLIRNWEVLIKARKEEAARLRSEQHILENARDRLKGRLLDYMDLHGKGKIQTARSQVWPQNNGGEAPMWVDPIYEESPALLPEQFTKVEINRKALRESLESGADLRDEHGNRIAELMPRGRHLRIK